MQKHIVIRSYEEDGEKHLAIDVLQEGYNLIEFTMYEAEDLAQSILDRIKER